MVAWLSAVQRREHRVEHATYCSKCTNMIHDEQQTKPTVYLCDSTALLRLKAGANVDGMVWAVCAASMPVLESVAIGNALAGAVAGKAKMCYSSAR